MSVEVFGIPPGTGYLIELRAIVDDGTSCSGSAPFDVMAGIATPVAVMINCKPERRFGSVRVNGKLNVCAELVKAVVAPLQTSVGSTIDLSAQGFDAEGDPVSYLWSASGGPIGSPASQVTQYLCASPGRQVIRIEVSDDDFTDCIDAWDVEVQCDGDGGGTGGTDGTPAQCISTDNRCRNANIDPIVEDPTCMLNEPPNLPEACTGLESTTNPASCTPTGGPVISGACQHGGGGEPLLRLGQRR